MPSRCVLSLTSQNGPTMETTQLYWQDAACSVQSLKPDQSPNTKCFETLSTKRLGDESFLQQTSFKTRHTNYTIANVIITDLGIMGPHEQREGLQRKSSRHGKKKKKSFVSNILYLSGLAENKLFPLFSKQFPPVAPLFFKEQSFRDSPGAGARRRLRPQSHEPFIGF